MTLPAQSLTVDFSQVPEIEQHAQHLEAHENDDRPRDANGKLLTPKQIRARARRRGASMEVMSPEELAALYPQKSVEDWDMDELAAGRPRNSKGSFTGPKPKWISREIHERSMERFITGVKRSMNITTVKGLDTLEELLDNDDVDEKGKPIVSPGTKVDIAKFLIEHVIGKPTQRVETDVSVKLQGLLGAVMVNPSDMPGQTEGYTPAHYPGITMRLAEKGDAEEEYDFGE